MKINVKTLKGVHFPVEVNPQDTVAQLKQTIEASQGAALYPANQQKLIHKGKILDDNTTLVQNGVSDDSFLVIMLSKAKNPGQSSSSNPSVAAATPPPATPAPAAASVPPPSPSPSPATPEMEGTIQQILEMGGGMWEREYVVRALAAASNNPDRAIDFLYSGIPPPQVVAPQPATTNALPQQPAVSSATGPNANPLNLFPQGLPNLSTNTNTVDSSTTTTTTGAGTGVGTGVFDFMRNDPRYEVMRAMVLQQPALAGEIIQNLSNHVPDIARLIQENPEEFNRYLSEPINQNIITQDFNRLVQEDQQTMTVTLTREEAEAVERLVAMGFDQQEVLQAYMAHEKNEELTANFLLDSMNDV